MVRKTWIFILAVMLSPLLVSAQDFNDSPDCEDDHYVALLFPTPKHSAHKEKEFVDSQHSMPTITVGSATASPTASPSLNIAINMVNFAEQFLGMNYRVGGNGSNGGFDCSGFIHRIFQEVGMDLPRSSVAQANFAKRIELEEVKTGDLIFFKGRNRGSNSVGHVAMVSHVAEDGSIEIIHATNHGGVMKENPFKNEYFAPRYLFAARVLNQ